VQRAGTPGTVVVASFLLSVYGPGAVRLGGRGAGFGGADGAGSVMRGGVVTAEAGGLDVAAGGVRPQPTRVISDQTGWGEAEPPDLLHSSRKAWSEGDTEISWKVASTLIDAGSPGVLIGLRDASPS